MGRTRKDGLTSSEADMHSTTFLVGSPTLTLEGSQAKSQCSEELIAAYEHLLDGQRLSWTTHHRLQRLLGAGGQGVVFLGERRGTDNFTLPVALKIFSPLRYEDERSYEEAMLRIAKVAARVAQIQQDNLLDVHNFVDRNRIRLMEMEWIDGFDLNRLLTREMFVYVQHRVSNRRWTYINNVIVTDGPTHPRLKAGIAIAIMRECLAALAALHREDIVHGDIKPANIMLKRTGNAKIVDIGSAIEIDDPPTIRTCTPTYASPEVLDGAPCTPRSDLASLGYVLIEMLAGMHLFSEYNSLRDLLAAKRELPRRLDEILPEEVSCNRHLMTFCRTLIAPDPELRFASAEAADLEQEGAALFQRQLVKGDLASEYGNEIRLWLGELE